MSTEAPARRPAAPKKTAKPYLIAAAVIAFTIFSAQQVGFSLAEIGENLESAREFLGKFWPPDWEWAREEVPGPLIETFQIAILAAIIGCTVALPIAFWASRLTASSSWSYYIDKWFLNIVRTIPDIFWAMIFVVAVGFGAFAGLLALIMFSLSIMGKLLSETVDSADPGPLEAAKASGARHIPAVRSSVMPQVLPNYVAYGLYIFELDIRASTVLGIVGAGGIGRVLEAQRSFFRFDRIMAVVIVIFVVVFAIEQVSVYIRRRLV
jgi:phosphonate transport system permease protein